MTKELLSIELDSATVKQILGALQAENQRLTSELEAARQLLDKQKKKSEKIDVKHIHPLIENKPLYTASDIAHYYGTSAVKIFEKLGELNVVHRCPADIAIHNRPTQEFFETGWFWRVERYSASKRECFFQTFIVSEAIEPIMRLLEENV